MSLIARLVTAVVVAVIVTLGCILVGSILVSLDVEIAVTIGDFLKKYSGVLGVLAGLWHFFAGGWTPFNRA